MKPYNLLFNGIPISSQDDIIKDLTHFIGTPTENADNNYIICYDDYLMYNEDELEIFYYSKKNTSSIKISNPVDIKKILFENISPNIKTLYMNQHNEYSDHVLDEFDEIKVLGFDLPPNLKKRNNVELISLIDYVTITIKNHLLSI